MSMKTSRLVFFASVLLQLFDLGALAPDDDAGPRSADGDAQLVAGAIHFDRADAGRLQPLAQAAFSSRSSCSSLA
jgi:hypothetical protein